MIRTLMRAVVASALLAAPASGVAQDFAAIAERALPSDLAELRSQDTRVMTLGYRLATGNVAFCRDKTAFAGLLLHDMVTYSDPDETRAAFGLTGDVGVQAIVPRGPADRAGLAVDQTVLAVGDLVVAEMDVPSKRRWERIEAIRAEAERQLAETGQLQLTVMQFDGPQQVVLEGEPACRSRFEVGDDSRAVADGHRVVIGARFTGLDYSDPLLAALLAHEFGHNVLHHREWFDEHGRKRNAVRLTEREADRIMPWLLANAGFEPTAAADFFRKWGPWNDGWIFRKRTHDGWDERVEFIEGELPTVERLMAETGRADWSIQFRRESLPED